MGTKQHTPSVIAKLMGLDELPPQPPIRKQQRVLSENYLRKTAAIGSQEKRLFGRSFRINSEKQQEFKDVFEVSEISNKYIHHIQSIEKEKANSSMTEAKMAFVRQKFTDAKCPSMDEKLQHSKEFDDVLEDLDSNKDILLRYLRQSDSPFTNLMCDFQGLQPHCSSGRITVLKSSNFHNYRSNEKCSKSEKTTARGNVLRSPRKLEHGFISKDETFCPTTRIVVLKPHLGKGKNASRSLFSPSSCLGSQSGDRKQEFPCRINGEVYNEVRDGKIPVNDLEPSRHGFSVSGGTVKVNEITRKIRNSTSNRFTEVSRSEVTVDDYTYLNEPEVMMPSCANFFGWKNQDRTSYFSSNGPSFTTEGKKRLLERWKMTRSSQEMGPASKGCTLGEMLAMPDQVTQPRNLNCKPDKRGLCSQFSLHGGNSDLCSPLCICSKDGWKDAFVSNLPRSGSLPASCNAIGSPKSRTSKEAFNNGGCLRLEEAVTESSSCIDLENNHTVQETQVILDELENKLEEEDLSKGNSVVAKLSCCDVPCSDSDYNHQSEQRTQVIQDEPENSFEENKMYKNTENNSRVLNSSMSSLASVSIAADVESDAVTEDIKFSCGDPNEQQPEPRVCNLFLKDGHSCSHVWEASTGQESSIGSAEDGLVSSNCTRNELEFPMSAGDAYQLSPDSVLEPPFKEEIFSCSECFESVSGDLHGLWMKLQHLKSEAEDACLDGPGIVVSSDEDIGEGSIDYSEEKGKLMRLFRAEESRDFSYLVDVLDEAGCHGGNSKTMFERWHFPEYPVSPSVFEALEKKYGEQLSWKKSERRLLFDRINSGLMEILHPCMDIHMWAKPFRRRFSASFGRDVIEDDLWMLLVSQEKEVRKDLSEKALGRGKKWLELGDDIDIIVREIENFLFDELAVELACI